MACGGADGSPVHLFFVACRCADKVLMIALRSSGLKPRQYAQSQSITRAGVANRLGLAGTSATGMVQSLWN
jgi:hypothetical protein